MGALETLRGSVESLHDMCFGLRQVARSASESHPEPLDVAPWWSKVEPVLHAALPSGAQLVAVIPESLPRVLVDPAGLLRAILNLVVNAGEAIAEAGADRGAITFWADHDEQASIVRLGVRDNGPGMSPEVCERIFEPFFSTKTQCFSTGLGMTVVKSFVEDCGGRVSVESQAGAGTNIALHVPAA